MRIPVELLHESARSGWRANQVNQRLELQASTRHWPTAAVAMALLAAWTAWLIPTWRAWLQGGPDSPTWNGALTVFLAAGVAMLASVVAMRIMGTVRCTIDEQRIRMDTGVWLIRRGWTEDLHAVSAVQIARRKARVGYMTRWIVEGRRSHALSEHLSDDQAESLARVVAAVCEVPVGGAEPQG